jgi:purine-binding chemotaxis protein CheW
MDNSQKSVEAKQFVVFKIAQEEYGIDIHKVAIIEKMLNIARVPSTIACILGVINLRGEIIPVMNLRLRFDMPVIEPNDETRIIIFQMGEVKLGLLVDMVSEVQTLEDADIESLTSITNDRTLDYITGIGKSEGRLITLLNVEKLISEMNVAL